MVFACTFFLIALAMVVLRPSDALALDYHAVSSLISALFAKLVRDEFSRAPLTTGAALVSASVSIGLSMMPLAAAQWDRLISAADRALNSAKGAGRNCTVVSNEHEATARADQPRDPHGGELVPTLDDQINGLRTLGTLPRL